MKNAIKLFFAAAVTMAAFSFTTAKEESTMALHWFKFTARCTTPQGTPGTYWYCQYTGNGPQLCPVSQWGQISECTAISNQ